MEAPNFGPPRRLQEASAWKPLRGTDSGIVGAKCAASDTGPGKCLGIDARRFTRDRATTPEAMQIIDLIASSNLPRAFGA